MFVVELQCLQMQKDRKVYQVTVGARRPIFKKRKDHAHTVEGSKWNFVPSS